jgi:hypothetical protein
MAHHAFEHVHNASVGRLTQGREHGFGFAHAAMLQDGRQSGYRYPIALFAAKHQIRVK